VPAPTMVGAPPRWRICSRLFSERVGLVEARQLSEVLQATQRSELKVSIDA